MGQSYFNIEKDIEIAIDSNKPINLISYALSEDMEKKLEKVIEKILERFDRSDLISTVYTCIKELAINGTKANIKKIYFDELNVDYSQKEEYQNGLKVFKEHFNENWLYQYGRKAKDAGYFVKIKFYYDDHGMRAEVTNNVQIHPVDEKRIREKLAKAMQYDSIADFYMQCSDNTEGEGIGIALVVLLLKGEGMDPNLFRVGIINRLTTARIEIPFSKEFKTLRETTS